MPELPDIIIYIEALQKRTLNQSLQRTRIVHPFLLRTAEPSLSSVENKKVLELQRIGKRIAIGLEDELWLLIHLMIAGRLHWRSPGAGLRGKGDLVAFDFSNGSLVLTESGTKKRALTDPHLFSGIGNAYSDEILFRARLSPVALTQNLTRSKGCTMLRKKLYRSGLAD